MPNISKEDKNMLIAEPFISSLNNMTDTQLQWMVKLGIRLKPVSF
jgi:hypothetical protein